MTETVNPRQGSPAWLEARRSLVTATDIPILLGVSRWSSEADLADEKLGLAPPRPASLRMRAGLALQDLIGEAYTEQTGLELRRYLTLVRHPQLRWAACSPDFRTVGQRRLVEAKRSSYRKHYADGLPQDVEAQAQWQLGITGYPRCDVAAWLGDDEELTIYTVERDENLFVDLVAIAEDFRARLEAGGPFSRDLDRIRREWPTDNGLELEADEELEQLAAQFQDVRSRQDVLKETRKELEKGIKERMREVSVLRGRGWHITWKQNKDSTTINWQGLAQGLLTERPEEERETLIGLHSVTEQGPRVFRVVKDDDEES